MLTAMPLPTIAGTVRVAFQGKVPSGQQWVNVWHVRYAGGASAPGASDITALDAIITKIYFGTAAGGGQTWFANCNAATTVEQTTYLPLDNTSLATVVAHPATGVGASNSLPSEVAHVLTLRSAMRGRSRRGRIYLPCQTIASLTATGESNSGNIAAFITNLNAIKGLLGGPATTPFWEFGIASYKLSVFTPLASFTMDGHPDVQTRRRM